jgi:hypothetical protein
MTLCELISWSDIFSIISERLIFNKFLMLANVDLCASKKETPFLQRARKAVADGRDHLDAVVTGGQILHDKRNILKGRVITQTPRSYILCNRTCTGCDNCRVCRVCGTHTEAHDAIPLCDECHKEASFALRTDEVLMLDTADSPGLRSHKILTGGHLTTVPLLLAYTLCFSRMSNLHRKVVENADFHSPDVEAGIARLDILQENTRKQYERYITTGWMD